MHLHIGVNDKSFADEEDIKWWSYPKYFVLSREEGREVGGVGGDQDEREEPPDSACVKELYFCSTSCFENVLTLNKFSSGLLIENQNADMAFFGLRVK